MRGRRKEQSARVHISSEARGVQEFFHNRFAFSFLFSQSFHMLARWSRLRLTLVTGTIYSEDSSSKIDYIGTVVVVVPMTVPEM